MANVARGERDERCPRCPRSYNVIIVTELNPRHVIFRRLAYWLIGMAIGTFALGFIQMAKRSQLRANALSLPQAGPPTAVEPVPGPKPLE